jgi:hypothetical protein
VADVDRPHLPFIIFDGLRAAPLPRQQRATLVQTLQTATGARTMFSRELNAGRTVGVPKQV